MDSGLRRNDVCAVIANFTLRIFAMFERGLFGGVAAPKVLGIHREIIPP